MDSDRANSPKTSQFEIEPWPIIRTDNGGFRDTIVTENVWRNSGVPARHQAKTMIRQGAEGPWGEAYQRIRDSQRSLIVLVGPRGTGKTQLAVCLLADVCRTGRSVSYLKVMDLFRRIRSCYRPGGPDEVDVVNRICGVHALVLDEAQERSDSDWESRTLTNVIDKRYDADKLTILVSNLQRQDFGKAVGPSIASRINEAGYVVVCDWKSFRTPEAQAA